MATERIALLRQQLTQSQSPQTTIDITNDLAKALDGYEPDEAYRLAQRAYNLAHSDTFAQNPYIRGQIGALYVMASVKERAGDFQQAIAHSTQALALSENAPKDNLYIKLLNIVAWVHFGLGNYPHSIDIALKQLAIAEELGDLDGQAEAHNMLGALYSEMDNINNLSIEHYQKSLAIYQQLNDSEGEAILYNNLCIEYQCANQLSQALLVGNQGLKLYETALPENHTHVLLLGNLSIVHRKIGNWEQAYDFAQQHYQKAKNANYRLLECHSLHIMSELLLEQRDLIPALAMAQQALTLATELKATKMIVENHEILAQIYEQQGNFESALYHLKNFHTLERQALNQTNQEHMAQLKIRYEIEKMERELAQERY